MIPQTDELITADLALMRRRKKALYQRSHEWQTYTAVEVEEAPQGTLSTREWATLYHVARERMSVRLARWQGQGFAKRFKLPGHQKYVWTIIAEKLPADYEKSDKLKDILRLIKPVIHNPQYIVF